MGNKVSSGGGSVDAATECAKVANAFAPAFVRAYGLAVVVQLRREQDLDNHGGAGAAGSSGGSGAHLQYALERPPVATEPLESGWLIKLGEIKKSWRRRFFVAAEESDNFCVRYFEKESEAGDVRRAKGSIYLAGYVPRAISADEGFGEHVLALEPLDKRAKRTYYLRCDSEDQRQRWKLVLRLGSLKCAPPLSPEPAMAEAFKQAYARSRRAAGLGGYYVLDRPEQEQLAALCIEAVRAKIAAAAGGADGGDASSASAASGDASPAAAAAAAIASSGGGTGPNRKSMSAGSSSSAGGSGAAGGKGGAANAAAAAREAFEKEVSRLANDASAAAWAAASARVELRRDALQRRAGDSLPEISRAEEELRARLRGSISDYVSPLAQAAAAPLLPALLGALLKPLYKAYKETIRVFFGRAQDILRRGLRERELRSFYRDARCQEGALGPALRKLRALTRGEVDEDDAGDATMALLSDLPVPLSDLRDMLAGDGRTPGGGFSLWEIEVEVEESLRQLLGWAIYSFVAAVERSRGGTTPVKCLVGVTRDMLHDARLRLRHDVSTVLRRVLVPTVRARALELPPVAAALAPTSELHGRPSFAVVSGSGKGDGPSSSPTASGGAGAAGSPAVAGAVKVNKKTKAAAEGEVAEAKLGELFTDGDWALDELLAEAVDASVKADLDAGLGVYEAKLDKLSSKLGLDGGAGAAAGGAPAGVGAAGGR